MTKHESTPIENWISTGQAAKRLGVSRRHVDRLIQSGKLEGRMIAGALWLVNPDSLEGWTRKRKQKGGNE
jgi:excisionase family DNA binding protein